MPIPLQDRCRLSSCNGQRGKGVFGYENGIRPNEITSLYHSYQNVPLPSSFPSLRVSSSSTKSKENFRNKNIEEKDGNFKKNLIKNGEQIQQERTDEKDTMTAEAKDESTFNDESLTLPLLPSDRSITNEYHTFEFPFDRNKYEIERYENDISTDSLASKENILHLNDHIEKYTLKDEDKKDKGKPSEEALFRGKEVEKMQDDPRLQKESDNASLIFNIKRNVNKDSSSVTREVNHVQLYAKEENKKKSKNRNRKLGDQQPLVSDSKKTLSAPPTTNANIVKLPVGSTKRFTSLREVEDALGKYYDSSSTSYAFDQCQPNRLIDMKRTSCKYLTPKFSSLNLSWHPSSSTISNEASIGRCSNGKDKATVQSNSESTFNTTCLLDDGTSKTVQTNVDGVLKMENDISELNEIDDLDPEEYLSFALDQIKMLKQSLEVHEPIVYEEDLVDDSNISAYSSTRYSKSDYNEFTRNNDELFSNENNKFDNSKTDDDKADLLEDGNSVQIERRKTEKLSSPGTQEDQNIKLCVTYLSHTSSPNQSSSSMSSESDSSTMQTEEKFEFPERSLPLKQEKNSKRKHNIDMPGCNAIVSDVENEFESISAKARSTVEKYVKQSLDYIDKKVDETFDSKIVSVEKKTYDEIKTKFQLGNCDEDTSDYISLGPDPYFKSRRMSDNALILKHRSKWNEDERTHHED